jgi:mannose/fructose/N-acetylgalactosamine-specific phosphotransferase system component IIC
VVFVPIEGYLIVFSIERYLWAGKLTGILTGATVVPLALGARFG